MCWLVFQHQTMDCEPRHGRWGASDWIISGQENGECQILDTLVFLWNYLWDNLDIDLALNGLSAGTLYLTLSFTTHMYVLLVCMYPPIPYTLVLHWRCGEVTLRDQSKFEKMGSVNFYTMTVLFYLTLYVWKIPFSASFIWQNFVYVFSP